MAYLILQKKVGTGSFAGAWDLVNASYDSKSFSVASQAAGPNEIHFSSDGTKMYIASTTPVEGIFQYTLSTAWDVTTASYDSIVVDVSSQELFPTSLYFKDDGTRMYFCGPGSDTVYQYTLSSAWDLSTASYDSISYTYSEESDAGGLHFSSDGTKMYIIGSGSNAVYQYTLSTPWNVSTASYDSVSFSVAGQGTNIKTLFFKPDGTKLYVSCQQPTPLLEQYTLSTPWNVSTASYDSVSFSASAQENSMTGMFFRPTGSQLFLCGAATDSVYQYSVLS